jgi:hypothetical protein
MIQESEKGSWHVPKSGNDDDILTPREWMCITRTGHADPCDSKSEELTISSTSILELSVSEVQEQVVANSELKDASIPGDEIQSLKPRKSRKSRKSTPKSSVSSSLESSTLRTSEVKKLEGDARPKKSRSHKASTVPPSDAGELEEQPKPRKKGASATKKPRSPKSSTQPSDAGELEERLTPPKGVRSATKKSRSPRSSELIQKLEAAEKLVGDPIHFEI